MAQPSTSQVSQSTHESPPAKKQGHFAALAKTALLVKKSQSQAQSQSGAPSGEASMEVGETPAAPGGSSQIRREREQIASSDPQPRRSQRIQATGSDQSVEANWGSDQLTETSSNAVADGSVNRGGGFQHSGGRGANYRGSGGSRGGHSGRGGRGGSGGRGSGGRGSGGRGNGSGGRGSRGGRGGQGRGRGGFSQGHTWVNYGTSGNDSTPGARKRQATSPLELTPSNSGSLPARVQGLEQQMAHMQNKVLGQGKLLGGISRRVENIERNQRCNETRFTGIPRVPDKTLRTLIKDVLVSGIKLNAKYVDRMLAALINIRRTGKNGNTILVTWGCQDHRDAVFQYKKQIGEWNPWGTGQISINANYTQKQFSVAEMRDATIKELKKCDQYAGRDIKKVGIDKIAVVGMVDAQRWDQF